MVQRDLPWKKEPQFYQLAKCFKRNPKDPFICGQYQKVKKEYKFLIKSYKKEWELTNIKKLSTLTENSKAFWSHLKTLRGKSTVTSEAPNLISADAWVKHFSTLCHSNQTDQDKIQVACNLRKKCDKTDSTLEAPIIIEEIYKTIKWLKTNKAAGHDSIINEY